MPTPYLPPDGDDLNAEFQRQCVSHLALCLQHCEACDALQHPPRWSCNSCGSRQVTRFTQVSGRGECYSAATSYRSLDKYWRSEVPFTTVVVTTAEGPRIITAWQGEGRPRIGDPVEVSIDVIDGRFTLMRSHRPSQ